MSFCYPTRILHRVTDITPQILMSMGVKALLLDVDNTLSEPDEQTPYPGTVEWVAALQKSGFSMMILSNNTRERVAPFAAQYGLDFETFAMKPLPIGYLRAAHRMKVSHKECVIVGDQIFTDIIGANLCGMKSILLDPIREEEGRSFQIRRKWEYPIRKQMGERMGKNE